MKIKNYREAESFLFSQLPMFQRIGPKAFKTDLKNIELLDNFLGHPHTSFKSIHIAGTNGKGSTAFFIATVLYEMGYKTGLYTSPHYKDYRERIRVDGKNVSREFVVRFLNRLLEGGLFNKAFKPSFFEINVGMAFEYFKETQVDYAVVETGLGGRLDSTNIIHPEISVITNIDLDHTAFLGNTIASIAAEKAGIIKNAVPVIVGRKEDESREVFVRIAKDRDAELIFAEDTDTVIPEPLKAIFPGYQYENMRSALTALNKLVGPVEERVVIKAWSSTIEEWSFTGRYKVQGRQPLVIADAAHNTAGIKQLFQQLQKEKFNDLHIVLGVVNDKDYNALLSLLPVSARYYFSEASIPRALNKDKLQAAALKFGLVGKSYGSIRRALAAAKRTAGKDDLVLVTGSIFTVAEVV